MGCPKKGKTMKLGIIGGVKEESFKSAAAKGLEFVEFCINVGTDPETVFADVKALKGWIRKHKVGVQSIGRWGSDRLDPKGKPLADELKACRKLVDVAAAVGCPHFVCGINYVKELTLLENYQAAADWLGGMIEYAKAKDVRVCVYNCRWNNYLVDPATWSVILQQLPELGIKFDPSHSTYAGGNYLKEMQDWGHRFHHVHIKGSLVIDGKRFDDPPAGLDQTNWGAFMAVLYAKNYPGGLSIEPHSSNWKGELGEKGVDFTIAFMKKLLFRE
jgi:sugar phosphate isomerase/epimerase